MQNLLRHHRGDSNASPCQKISKKVLYSNPIRALLNKIFTQLGRNCYEIWFLEMLLFYFPMREACKAPIKNRIYAGFPEPRSSWTFLIWKTRHQCHNLVAITTSAEMLFAHLGKFLFLIYSDLAWPSNVLMNHSISHDSRGNPAEACPPIYIIKP